MIKRFQIEDLIVQDTSGVVFRALDVETGRTVAVRRFFPFGADGGGLSADEQVAYNIAIGRLADINHIALRSVICGGCDPVDGMPFIATEWIEGEPLLPFIEQGPLTAGAATELLTQALEVSELLSHVLAEEAVWVETDLHTIIVGNPDSGRGFTFWISPLKWLGSNVENKGLESIISLTEHVMHWSGKKIGDEAARGLGIWLNWLRAHPQASLREARESLAAAIGEDPPVPVRKLVSRAAPPNKNPGRKPRKPGKPKAFLIINTSLAILTACLGSWVYLQNRAKTGELPAFVPAAIRNLLPPPASETEPAAEESEDLEIEEPAPAPAAAEVPQTAPPPAAAPAPAADPIAWNANKTLVEHNGKEAIVGGLLVNVAKRRGSQYLYLDFSRKPGKNDFCGIIEPKTAPSDLTESALKPLVGKRIRLHGRIDLQKNGGLRRPIIRITDRKSIEVLE